MRDLWSVTLEEVLNIIILNTLNVKKLQTIEVSFPLANFPMKCPHCEKSLWRFDMRKHVEKEHPEKECPAEAIISKAEKGIL